MYTCLFVYSDVHTYCAVFFSFSSSCVVSFSGLSSFDCSIRYSLTFIFGAFPKVQPINRRNRHPNIYMITLFPDLLQALKKVVRSKAPKAPLIVK